MGSRMFELVDTGQLPQPGGQDGEEIPQPAVDDDEDEDHCCSTYISMDVGASA